MNFLREFLKKNLFVILTIFLLTLIAYGQTTQMYFLIDDNAVIYKLQHIDETLGYFGKGSIGQGPYRHIINQFVPFYPIFRVNALPYFAVGVFLYFLTAVSVYFFTKAISKNNAIALGASLIFASGYVGSETMFGITNSWQTMRGIMMALLTFFLYYKFIQTKGEHFYLFSVILFFLSLETVYIRAHGLIIVLIAFDLIFNRVKWELKTIFGFLLRILPFLAIHYHIYFSTFGQAKGFGLLHLFEDVFRDGKILLLSIPLQDLGNLFIPNRLTTYVDKFLSMFFLLPKGDFSVGSLLAGSIIFVLFGFLILKHRKEDLMSKLLLFSIFWSIANFLIFYARETGHTLWTAHRYFTYSFVGVAIFWVTSFYLISKKLKKRLTFVAPTTCVIIIYLWLGWNYQSSFNTQRSVPAKEFFAEFRKVIPEITKGSILYFDIENSNQVRGRFGSFFGGMFSEASNFAIYTPGIDYMNDFLFTYDFEDIVSALEEKTISLDNVYTFYYSSEGLVDTTEKTRSFLENPESRNINIDNFSSITGGEVASNTFQTTGSGHKVTITLPPDTYSGVPSELVFSMSVRPLLPALPYKENNVEYDIAPVEKEKIFSYLLSRNGFRKTAIATSASFWKDQKPSFALDGRLETAWRGHRGYWDDIVRNITNNTEYFQVDLRQVLSVGQLMWVSAQKPLVPTEYRILTSTDGVSFEVVKSVVRKEEFLEGTVMFDSFSAVPARFVKMAITKTYGNDGPELKEFEVIEANYAELDRGFIKKIESHPFANIDTITDYNQALSYIKQNAKMRFYFMSDADKNQDPTKYLEVPLVLDNQMHEYKIGLPATGLSWTRFTIEGYNFPAEITIGEVVITY